MTQTPAGWYPDPEQQGQQRYWDGSQWTDHRVPLEPRQQFPSYPQPGEQQPSYQQPGQQPYGQPQYGAPPQPGYPAAYGAYQAPQGTSHTTRNVLIAIAVVFVLLVGGCAVVVGIAAKGVDNAVDNATEDHTVTYRVTGTAATATITYTGEDDTATPETSQTLPFETTVEFTDTLFSFYTLSATGEGDGSVSCEILVDGTSIDTDEGTDGFSFALCSGSDSD